ncbi:MAG: LTA synthase family protein [Bacilli bacterium]
MKLKSSFLIYFIEIVFLELLVRHLFLDNVISPKIIYVITFSTSLALILSLVTKIFPKIINKILTIFFSLVISIYFGFQFIFFKLFSVPFSFNTIELADQALDFIAIIKEAILNNIGYLVVILITFIITCIFIRKIDSTCFDRYQILSYLLLITASCGLDYYYLVHDKQEYDSPYNLYKQVDDQIALIDQFGLLSYTEIDIKRVVFGFNLEDVNLIIDEQNNQPSNEEIIYGNNELDIDFNKLISETDNKSLISLHEYFRDSEGSNKNKYTGMFKDKNLIFILAEGFNEVAVDESRTPTLYKLIHEGFNFTDFYSPVFLSTTGGEFQATTGLIPTQEILRTWKNSEPSLKYALGHTFNDLGYTVNAYHDWTYTYYKRHITMETLGYDSYMGCNNGMEDLLSCKWLPSDSEMMKVTAPLYMNNERFHTYYVTVSGHSPYARGANIVNKHYNSVANLNMSENIKYYLASQIELDKALEELMNQLQISGHLDDTVIALVGDHYPYTLTAEEVSEAASYKKDEIVEVNHSNFILWSNDMEPTTITKTGSQIDVLPTLLNLFGIPYDSRLIVGKDILSDYEGIAIFSNRSWVTDKGTYYANKRKFIPNDGVDVEDGYVESINKRVSNAFVMSKLIMDNDYYLKIKE